MKTIFDIVILIIGFILLVKGADYFVEGSAGLARRFGIPGTIVGLTIVAMGTSAPELAVSTSAAIQGSNEIALSNVVGSNIFNLLMVLGICAMIKKVPVDKVIVKRDLPLSIAGAVLVLLFVGRRFLAEGRWIRQDMDTEMGVVGRGLAFLLLAIFILYMTVLVTEAKKTRKQEPNEELLPLWKCLCFLLVGLICIIAGGQFAVYAAKAIARAAHVSETLIGLTIVAIGTSLPELVTSVVAAKKGENGMAVGNVVGSNLFNLFFILGVSAAIHPIAVNLASIYDLFILIVVSVVTYFFALGKRITGWQGCIMVLLYVTDVIFAMYR